MQVASSGNRLAFVSSCHRQIVEGNDRVETATPAETLKVVVPQEARAGSFSRVGNAPRV